MDLLHDEMKAKRGVKTAADDVNEKHEHPAHVPENKYPGSSQSLDKTRPRERRRGFYLSRGRVRGINGMTGDGLSPPLRKRAMMARGLHLELRISLQTGGSRSFQPKEVMQMPCEGILSHCIPICISKQTQKSAGCFGFRQPVRGAPPQKPQSATDWNPKGHIEKKTYPDKRIPSGK